MFKKVLILAIVIQVSLASENEASTPSTLTMLQQSYSKAIIGAFRRKVSEMQDLLANGENPLPVAYDILKIAMAAQPSPLLMKTVVENVLGKMDMKKYGIDENEILATIDKFTGAQNNEN
jgi:hypothetical protein